MVRNAIKYDPETGIFIWIISSRPGWAGKRAGFISREGYRVIRVFDRNYRAHRLAWLCVMGVWPEIEVDHRNRIKDDDRFDNLRLATHVQNMANLPVYRNNKTGCPGVAFHKRGKPFQATARVNGKRIYIGRFDTVEEAAVAYRATVAPRGEFLSTAIPV